MWEEPQTESILSTDMAPTYYKDGVVWHKPIAERLAGTGHFSKDIAGHVTKEFEADRQRRSMVGLFNLGHIYADYLECLRAAGIAYIPGEFAANGIVFIDTLVDSPAAGVQSAAFMRAMAKRRIFIRADQLAPDDYPTLRLMSTGVAWVIYPVDEQRRTIHSTFRLPTVLIAIYGPNLPLAAAHHTRRPHCCVGAAGQPPLRHG